MILQVMGLQSWHPQHLMKKSWLGDGRTHSLYTGILTTAMTVNRKIRQGRVSLADINEEVKQLIKIWNMKNPDRIQHPIYRTA